MKRQLATLAALGIVIAGSSLVPPCAASELAARAQIERLIRRSGADVAVAFRTLDGGATPTADC